jgi:hypothetical protein
LRKRREEVAMARKAASAATVVSGETAGGSVNGSECGEGITTAGAASTSTPLPGPGVEGGVAAA